MNPKSSEPPVPAAPIGRRTFVKKGAFRELLPLGEQRVRLRVPLGRRVAAVRLLVADRRVPVRAENGELEIVVPEIRDREVIAVDLAS